MIQFQPGSRFAALAISRALNVELPSVSTARDAFVVVQQLPFDLGADWRATLGTFRTERLEASNFLIFASESSPYVNERHRDPLIRKIRAFYYALIMLGGPAHESGLLFAGGVTSTGPNVLYAQDLIPAVPRPLGHPTPITAQALEVAADISDGIVGIQGRKTHDRLERGFWTWVGAVREQHLHVRLHQFVRSIDALVGSEQGKGEKQFILRGQTFTEGRDVESILSQLYRLRSVEEHFRPWQPILGLNGSEAERVGALRAYQAERLASHVYAIVFANASIRNHFRDEHSIAAFWAMKETEREAQWPHRLDLSAIEAEHNWQPEILHT